jgi:hypothetical protein
MPPTSNDGKATGTIWVEVMEDGKGNGLEVLEGERMD